jgi:hypothetical protein
MLPISSLSLRWAGIVCLIVITCLTGLTTERAVSVCDVLSKLDHYRGRMIAVRAMLSGGYHGQFLTDWPGNEPCEQVREQGRAWPPAIAVVRSTKYADLEDGPAKFESDTRQIEAALAEAEKVVKSDHRQVIVATFVGELRSRKDIQIIRKEEGWYMGIGYAQSGQYPALLVLKTVCDCEGYPEVNAEGSHGSHARAIYRKAVS